MSDYQGSINQQYSQTKLNDRILGAFESAGIDIDALTLDDLSQFDQLHPATRIWAGGCRRIQKAPLVDRQSRTGSGGRKPVNLSAAAGRRQDRYA